MYRPHSTLARRERRGRGDGEGSDDPSKKNTSSAFIGRPTLFSRELPLILPVAPRRNNYRTSALAELPKESGSQVCTEAAAASSSGGELVLGQFKNFVPKAPLLPRPSALTSSLKPKPRASTTSLDIDALPKSAPRASATKYEPPRSPTRSPQIHSRERTSILTPAAKEAILKMLLVNNINLKAEAKSTSCSEIPISSSPENAEDELAVELDERDRAFLRLLGWCENKPDEYLTANEITSFIDKYEKLRPSVEFSGRVVEAVKLAEKLVGR